MVRSFALLFSAIPLLLWPGFVLAAFMPPPGGWWSNGALAALFIGYSMFYPVAFYLGYRASALQILKKRPLDQALVAITPLLIFIVLRFGSGKL